MRWTMPGSRLPAMTSRPPNARSTRPWFSASWLLEFRPWMLALAVFLACALGIAVMEQFDGRVMWAQAEPQHAPQDR